MNISAMGKGQADVNFENEGLTGLAAVGSYLNDVARRFGIRQEKRCDRAGGGHWCLARISGGRSLLSPPSTVETEYFRNSGHSPEYRLMCQTRIAAEGEVVIMTDAARSTATGKAKAKDLNEEFKKAFEKMPLEKKIANLVDLEAMTLGDTFSYVLNSPFKVFEKVVDAMADFGFRKEESAKAAERPDAQPAARAARKVKTGAKKQKRSRKPKKAADA